MNAHSKAEPEIKYLGELQRVDVKPGDRFVLMVDRQVSDDMVAHIRGVWSRFMGEDMPILVLEQGMKIGVISDPNYIPD